MKLMKCFLAYSFVSDFLVIYCSKVSHLQNFDMTEENLIEILILMYIKPANLSMFSLMVFVSVSKI